MPIAVQCPECGKELMAPDQLKGKLAACPQCETQFPVQPPTEPPGSSTSDPPAPAKRAVFKGLPASETEPPVPLPSPPAPAPPDPPPQRPPATPTSDLMPPTSRPPKPPEPAAKSTPSETLAHDLLPPTARPSHPSDSDPPTISAADSPTLEMDPPESGASTQPAGRSNARWRGQEEASQAVSDQKASSAGGVARTAQRARFITAEATSTPLPLSVDGELPSLKLAEDVQPEKDTENTAGSNPLVLVIALGFSFLATAAMLFVDPNSAVTESTSTAEARENIERYYTTPSPLLKPYQDLLRRALQAHHREDYATEQRLYRRVLDLLHSESNSENRGLTGQVRSAQPPNDADLERLLSSLLSERR